MKKMLDRGNASLGSRIVWITIPKWETAYKLFNNATSDCMQTNTHASLSIFSFNWTNNIGNLNSNKPAKSLNERSCHRHIKALLFIISCQRELPSLRSSYTDQKNDEVTNTWCWNRLPLISFGQKIRDGQRGIYIEVESILKGALFVFARLHTLFWLGKVNKIHASFVNTNCLPFRGNCLCLKWQTKLPCRPGRSMRLRPPGGTNNCN